MASARVVAERSAQYFAEHGRSFPWRGERDIYRLAIAEILLQKTRAEAVIDCYNTMVRRFPTPTALLEASPGELSTILRPLGLSNKRTLQFEGMARAMVNVGPSPFKDWRYLLSDVPGLGAYAARAIACFALGEAVGIVDANTGRILRRFFRIRSEDNRAATYQWHADRVAEAAADPRSTNFGLLDIGATICLGKPLCAVCPLNDLCPRYRVAPM